MNLNKMKIFHTIQKAFGILGFSSNQSLHRYPFNGRIWMGFVVFGICLISYLYYLFNIANTFMEYTQSVYVTGAVILIGSSYIIILIKMKKLFQFIDFVEDLPNGKASSLVHLSQVHI